MKDRLKSRLTKLESNLKDHWTPTGMFRDSGDPNLFWLSEESYRTSRNLISEYVDLALKGKWDDAKDALHRSSEIRDSCIRTAPPKPVPKVLQKEIDELKERMSKRNNI